MAQVLRKEYQCFGCGNNILVSKIDNPAPGQKKRWEQWERDGTTPHNCSAKFKGNKDKQQQQTTSVDNGSQIAALAQQLKDLKDTVNILISQIQMLRSDVKSKNTFTAHV
jgi:hypothetical protein